MKRLLLLIFLIFPACSRGAFAGATEGYAAYTRGDYEAAMREFRPLAAHGDPAAQIAVGWLYDNALGVPHDDVEAIKWYRRAALQGCATAQHYLGMMYAEGEGAAKDFNEAVKWFRLAADQGYAGGQYGLGIIYRDGAGATRDPVEALKWFRLAGAADGHGAQGQQARVAESQLTQQMKPDEIQKAERLADTWKAPHPPDRAHEKRCSFDTSR
ncbi:MAG: tetratricopeptide repeat protein [Rhodospirillaceae bacterium]